MADSIRLGAYHLADNPKIYEPVTGNVFEFLVYGLNDPTGAFNYQEAIRMQVVSFPRPYVTVARQEIRKGNSVITFGGLPSFSAGSLVIKDYVGSKGRSALEYWNSLVYDTVNDRAGRLADYKKDCDVLEYTSDGAELIGTWHLKGCWVSGLSEGAYDNTQKDSKDITAQIEYDKAIFEPNAGVQIEV